MKLACEYEKIPDTTKATEIIDPNIANSLASKYLDK
tara:strand:- start:278 stop:385 length:108 start_codon:yes stop_codon:yes gene_type:complete